MKSTVKQSKSKQSKKYPYLGIFLTDGLIVLFSEAGKGTVINNGKPPYTIGQYRADWLEENATEFEGEVTLSN